MMTKEAFEALAGELANARKAVLRWDTATRYGGLAKDVAELALAEARRDDLAYRVSEAANEIVKSDRAAQSPEAQRADAEKEALEVAKTRWLRLGPILLAALQEVKACDAFAADMPGRVSDVVNDALEAAKQSTPAPGTTEGGSN